VNYQEKLLLREQKKKSDEIKINIDILGITISNKQNGVEVISIDNQESNLQIGDIILEVNRELVNDTNSFNKLVTKLEKTGRSSLLLKIIRNDEQLWVTIKFNN
tara:strand:+ start:221 stop:532 length:312 start_codon:yes stop_codon:yes gene_type:complete